MAAASPSISAKLDSAAAQTHTSKPNSPQHSLATYTKQWQAATAADSIYVKFVFGCGTSLTPPGSGTQADPYCSLQTAVNAAVSGDTILVSDDGDGYSDDELVTIRTSNLTIIGPGNGDAVYADPVSGTALTVDGAQNVAISGLSFSSYALDASVVDSSGITFDSDYFNGSGGGLAIDGSSSGVTVSRSGFTSAEDVTIAAGAKDVTVASNIMAGSARNGGIAAVGVAGLDIDGNTIQRSCAAGISVSSTSSNVYVENNVLEDASTTDQNIFYDYAYCTAVGLGWPPDVVVDSSSATATTSDYNDFHTSAPADTSPYSWAGTTYPTLAAFLAGTKQGSHDLDDPVPNSETATAQFELEDGVDAFPMPGSTAIGSADTGAPGRLSSDYAGNTPYSDRGALAFSPDRIVPALSLTEDTALRVWGEDEGSTSLKPLAKATVFWGDGQDTVVWAGMAIGAHVYQRPGTYTVELVLTDVTNQTGSTSVTFTTAGNDFTAYGPTRLLDTRSGIGAPAGQVPAQGTVHLKIVGAGPAADPIPADVTAVVLNITVTDDTGSGFITAYADGDPSGVPTASNVNYVPRQTVPNLAIVPVGKDGDVALFNGGGTAKPLDLIADISGYFSPVADGGYVSLNPARLVDTRNGTGVPQGQVGNGGTLRVPIAGADGGLLPASGINAVALNVTVTNPRGDGFLTVYPDGNSTPNASNVNYGVGQTIANSVITPVGANGDIDITNGGATAAGVDVIVDVEGYYSTTALGTSAYVPLPTPARYLDTRKDVGPVANGGYVPLALDWDDNSEDPMFATSFVLNTTVTDTMGRGFLTVAPDPNSLYAYQSGTAVEPTPPNSSVLNWAPGGTVPNLVQAASGANGIVDVWNLGANGGTTDLIADVFGFYQND